MNISSKIRNVIVCALKEINEDIDANGLNFVIEIPKDNKNGDYASNIALQLTKIIKKKPREIAEDIISHINLIDNNIERIEIAGPGFINFYIKQDSLAEIISKIISKGDDYGKSNHGAGLSYNVEFISANPTGRLHLGHARQAALGDSLCRILEASGYSVTREYYVNDAGNQIHNLTLSVKARYLQLCGKEAVLPEDGYHGEDIIEIAKKIYEEYEDKFIDDNTEDTYWLIRNKSVEFELEQIKKDLLDFRVEMDTFSSESEIRKRGMVEHTIEILKFSGNVYTKDNALWLKSTDYGDDKDRVLIKSDGSYTYLTPDIAYHIDKLSRGYNYLVDLLGADHHGYINRLKASIMALGHNSDKLEVDIVQMVRLIKDGEEFKMSKRSGNAITLKELCNEVGVDAVRYFFISRSGSSHLDFDIGLAKSYSSDNPVYYAQYAHARMCSILESAKKLELQPVEVYDKISTTNETALLKILMEFEDVIIDCAQNRAPYKMANYIQHIAQLFHSFYNECRVIDENNLELTSQRLKLVQATKIVLANALSLIGVSAPQSM
ncbi:MAG: arginine--tRNA ligase [Erysipelotrichales bacterium]|nr:arginine--tRNA ligase [Erysipelotrichales bacterium]